MIVVFPRGVKVFLRPQADIVFVLRFMIDTKLRGASWVELYGYRIQIERKKDY